VTATAPRCPRGCDEGARGHHDLDPPRSSRDRDTTSMPTWVRPRRSRRPRPRPSSIPTRARRVARDHLALAPLDDHVVRRRRSERPSISRRYTWGDVVVVDGGDVIVARHTGVTATTRSRSILPMRVHGRANRDRAITFGHARIGSEPELCEPRAAGWTRPIASPDRCVTESAKPSKITVRAPADVSRSGLRNTGASRCRRRGRPDRDRTARRRGTSP
jgi:hypothetical protein